jgi:hypothetical protein
VSLLNTIYFGQFILSYMIFVAMIDLSEFNLTLYSHVLLTQKRFPFHGSINSKYSQTKMVLLILEQCILSFSLSQFNPTLICGTRLMSPRKSFYAIALQFQRYQNVQVATKQNHNYSQWRWSMYPCPRDNISRVTHTRISTTISVIYVSDCLIICVLLMKRILDEMNLLPGYL